MRLKRVLLGLSVVIVLLFAAKHFLLDTAAPPGARYVIDLAALHEAAVASGPLPTHIEVERIGDFAFPRTLVVAGDGFRMHPMVLLAHRVCWPDRSIVIDAAIPPKDAESIPGAIIHSDAYVRLERALAQAARIVFTHEHVDHVGGVASARDFGAIAPKTLITQEQLEGPRLERDKFAPGTLEQLKPLSYDGLYTMAPGVVLQKAPGHSTGTQLIYVELLGGHRYLFVGDIAWSEDNVTLQRGRPALVGWMAKEDREAVAAQLAAIAALPKDVHVVVAHDPVAYERDLRAGLFRGRFAVQ